VLANITQVFISLETFFLGVAVLPDMCVLTGRDQNLNFGRMCIEHIIDLAFVICSIGCTGKQSLFDLLRYHIFHDSIVADAVGAFSQLVPGILKLLLGIWTPSVPVT